MRARPTLAWACLLAMGAGAVHIGQQLPDHDTPWAPLAFEHPPNWLTRHKLQRLDSATCAGLLASTPLDATPLPDADTPAGCTLRDAVRVRRSALQIGPPLTLSCRAAVSLALWEHHVVQPAAYGAYGRPVVRLQHLGSLACRNIGGRPEGTRSQHASADALDVAGFVLQGGRQVSVQRGWNGLDDDAQFLRTVQAGACRFFDGVLGPEYNGAHADHLHLDRGPYTVCR